MKALIQAKLGMIAVMLGIVGALLGVGFMEAAQTAEHMIAAVGASFTSVLLMWAGVELVKAAE